LFRGNQSPRKLVQARSFHLASTGRCRLQSTQYFHECLDISIDFPAAGRRVAIRDRRGNRSGAPAKGPALGPDFYRPAPEPPGPSSRRAGVVISEIRYHPAARADGLNGQFIKVFNSLPWFQDMGGWRISGDVDFTFPTNCSLPSRGYAVIAADPVQFARVTRLTNVLGPFTGNLPNGYGTLRLRATGLVQSSSKSNIGTTVPGPPQRIGPGRR
jgi:hypothetical protein